MSDYLAHYIEWGLSGIVVTDYKEKELGNAYSRELTYETVVAKKGAGFVKVVLRKSVSFSPGSGGTDIGKDSEEAITHAEYQAATKRKIIPDTPAGLAQVQKTKDTIAAGYAYQAELRAKRAPFYAQLDKLTPNCPDCGKKMIQKSKKGDSSALFWGCPTFPRCDGLQNMTTEQRRLIDQIAAIK
jgi:hypothetical protein